MAAPWLRTHGHDWLATGVYDVYRLQCPQRPGHSFFLFGQQMGMEQCMVAIYAGWLAAGLAFALLRDRVRSPSVTVLVLVSLAMVRDLASQMVGLRDGTWFWRLTTGILFADASAWWGLPRVEIGKRAVATRDRASERV